MAAEVHEAAPVDAPAISDFEAPAKPNDNAQHVDAHAPSVNGTISSVSADELSNKHITDIVDNLVNSAEPSVSGGSDTEASTRVDVLKNKDANTGHVRTSSAVRKPATFKAVSVNKTFLASKAVSAASLTKSGDKASPVLGSASPITSMSSAKPRLVAKTGLVKGSPANGRPAAAPDPNAVWNKNRPPPVTDPRKLTDEELKEYGIHMARRLQQDDSKGQATWADIDDDDDWAPEEIRWTDGTKSTIPHHEEQSHQSQPPVGMPLRIHTQTAPSVHSVPSVLSKLSAPSVPSAPSVSSAPSAPSTLSMSSAPPVSLLSRDSSTSQKPALAAPASSSQNPRPSGLPSGRGLILKGAPEKPTLVAKPPASSTPVKSPWATLPPVEKADPVLLDLPPPVGVSRPPPQQQPFHTNQQRDVYGGPPRHATPPPPFKEIAADDFSRGNFRDGTPHMGRELFNSQSGRCEPVMDRRGGSRSDMHGYRQAPAGLVQRPSHSMDQQPEPSAAFQTHRASGQDGGPYGRRRNSSNVSGSSGSLLHRLGRSGDAQVPPELHNTHQPPLSGRSDSPASPRAFSPSGSRSWQSHGSPAATFAVPYAHGSVSEGRPPMHSVPPSAPVASLEDELELQKRVMRERRELAKKRRLEEEEREEKAKQERIRLKLEAMGPAPERKSAKKEISKDEAATPTVSTAAVSATAAPSTKPAGSASAFSETSSKAALREGQQSLPTEEANRPLDSAKGQHQQQQQSWQGSPQPQTDRIASWNSANQSSRNVWGSPNNRSLGNGTFNSDLVRTSDPYAQPVASIGGKSGPGPIGPPPASTIAPIGPPKPTIAATAPSTVIATSGPPPSISSAWAGSIKASDDQMFAQQKARQAEQKREVESRGILLKDLRPSIKDTWMPTRLNDEGDRVEDKTAQSVVHRPGNTTSGTSKGPDGATAAPAPATQLQQSRPSRFFPTRDARLDDASFRGTADVLKSGRTARGRHGSPSPPPPDMAGHPVYDGDAARPHVSLPRPQAVVKPPPKDTDAAPGGVVQDCGSWQARFDHLLNRKATSPSKPTVSITSIASRDDTTVTSLPPLLQRSPQASRPAPAERTHRLSQTAIEEPFASRVMGEECFEKQEMGSLPAVRIPREAPELAWTPAPTPSKLFHRRLLAVATSREQDGHAKDVFGAPYMVRIRIPGMMANATKMVSLSWARTHSNPRRGGGSRGGSGRHGSSHRGGSGKGRDTASNSGNNDHAGASAENNAAASGGNGSIGNGGYGGGGRSRGGGGGGGNGARHRSENWTRITPAPVQS